MRILMVIGTLSSEYGGPVTACISLASSFANNGNQVSVLAPISPNDHIDVKTASKRVEFVRTPRAFGRFRLSFAMIKWLWANITRYDLVIVHGVWQFHSLAVGLTAGRKLVPWAVFAHGALDPWFRSAYRFKHLKKSIYWKLIEAPLLSRCRALIFTSEDERVLAEKTFAMRAIQKIVVNYGILDPYSSAEYSSTIFFDAFPALKGKKILLFMSRIHRKKGVDLLIRGFAYLLKEDPDVRLVIAGPDEEGLGGSLRDLAKSLACEEAILWPGMLTGELKWAAYKAADLFCLISHSENFGIVVAEALAAGLPVAITGRVNIWRIIESNVAGFVCDDNVDGARQILHSWLALNRKEKENMCRAARNCFLDYFDINQSAGQILKLLADPPQSISSQAPEVPN